MDQKENKKGFLNIKVSLAIIQGLKKRAVMKGHTLRYVAEEAFTKYLEPKEERPEEAIESPRSSVAPAAMLVSCPGCGGNRKIWDNNTDSWECCERCGGKGKI
jgi:hypothetical protein